MSFRAVLQAFITVFPAELPDKSMFATIVLVSRFRRPLLVWVGVVAAFAIHVTVAVLAGRVLSLLPEPVVQSVVCVVFFGGAVLLVRAGRHAAQGPEVSVATDHPTAWATMGTSFGVIALAEWGDLTQLATAGLAARSGEPFSTAIGAWVALAAVAAIAAGFGQHVTDRIPLHRVNNLGAAVFASLGVWTLVELVW